VDRVALPQRRGVLLTAHRANNVDDPQRLGLLVRIVRSLSESFAPVVFPVHPRTRARLQEHGYLSALAGAPGLQLTEPLPYRELLRAVAAARIVVTDSGGLQEEASYLGVPCVVLRNSTPRWEGVLIGAARVCGLDPARALEAAHQMAEPSVLAHVAELPCPYGDGHAAERIVAALADPELVTELVPREHPAGLPAEVLAQLADA
jgi:UDP-N-acetylglucosamine 2-epimerase (non-hydrolysing)